MRPIKVTPEQHDLRIDVDRKQFALAMKTWRLRQGLSQRQVAAKFGLSRFTLIKLEQALPVSWETAYRAFAKLSHYLEEEGRS